MSILRDSIESRYEIMGNYHDNWMLLQLDRMKSADFEHRYGEFINRHIDELQEVDGSKTQRLQLTKEFYTQLATNFSNNLDSVYESVCYGFAKDLGTIATKLGTSKGIGLPGTVYKDANIKGKPLTCPQKDIIAAHEAYHGIVTANGPLAREVLSGFDLEKLKEFNDINGVETRRGYLRNADELMARMAQLKNYFGMTGDELFTYAHLEYAKQHYIFDTGLDNSISAFFAMIKDEEFIKLMNILPV